MKRVIQGRVVDTQGCPVAGARVFLVRYPGTPPLDGPSVVADESGHYVFEDAERSDVWRRGIRAIEGSRLSAVIEVNEREEAEQAPDLVVVPGTRFEIQVRWDDKTPAVGVPLIAVLSTVDEGWDGEGMRGETDEHGVLSVEPVPDRMWDVFVQATPAGAPMRTASWEQRRVGSETYELVLPRGRTVRGTVLTDDGRAAGGFRVAPFQHHEGVPETDLMVTVDEAGSYILSGVGDAAAGVAIYDQEADVGTDRLLLLCDIEDGRDEMEPITLPPLGTLSARFVDTEGGPVPGEVRYRLPDVGYSGSVHDVAADGVLRIARVPLGLPACLDLRYGDRRSRQRFDIRAAAEDETIFRVTGAGTVVVRIKLPGWPVEGFWDPRVDVRGLSPLGGTGRCPTVERRGWARPGTCPRLEITAAGHHGLVVEHVAVRRDGPTVVDVKLQPLID